MNDIKKVLIAAICVVLAVAIAAGVSIGVMAGTMNGLKDTVAELKQANDAQEALIASMQEEIKAAQANDENLVTAEDFEKKLAEALGAQTQTLQALITTAVKNQIEELGVEGLTEAQVQTIIDAAVENCLTEDDIDAIVADLDTGLTKDEVKKIVTNATAGYLTYAQIVNLVDDADYDLRAYLEKQMNKIVDDLNEQLAALGIKIDGVQGDLDNFKDEMTWDGESVSEPEYDEDEKTYTITSADELAWIAEQTGEAANNFKGQTIVLEADINLNNHEWTPIGNDTTKFEGNFDGQGHTISNLNVNKPNLTGVGLFGRAQNGKLENVTIKNAKIVGRHSVATLAGNPYTSDVSNITVTGLVTVDGKYDVGGVLGYSVYGDVTDIVVDVEEGSYVYADSVDADGKMWATYVGGVIGFMAEGGMKVTNVTSNIDVTGTVCYVGGIAGNIHYGNTFTNCVSTGDVTLTVTDEDETQFIGGIAGTWVNTQKDAYIVDCEFKGTLTSEADEFMFDGLVGKPWSTNGTTTLVLNGKALVSTTTALEEALENGEDVVLNADLEKETTATGYGEADIVVTGGVFDGNGKTVSVSGTGDYSAIVMNGGEIKNLTISDGFRALFLEDLTEDVTLTNVISGGEGICYAINTGAMSNGAFSLTAKNCTFNGWSSLADLSSVTFIECDFGQGGYYSDVAGRLLKPYVDAVLKDCTFIKDFYLDLSALGADCTVTLENCTVDDVKITAENWESYFNTIELPTDGRTLADCVIFK